MKLLRRKIGFKALENCLNQPWVSAGAITIIDLSKDFFLMTFTSDKDRDFALGQGPWLIYDHYLIVREWTPNFQPENAAIDSVAVWVRFSGLPIEYYGPTFLHCFGNRIGRTVKVDKYARLCVEVDLHKPLLAIFEVKGKQYNAEYEGLHLLCLKCGRFGHYKEGCTAVEDTGVAQDTKLQDNNGVEPNSLWTVVRKNRGNSRRRRQASRPASGIPGKKQVGSRYSVFNDELEISEAGENNAENEIVATTENYLDPKGQTGEGMGSKCKGSREVIIVLQGL